MQQFPIFVSTATEEGSSSEEEPCATWRKKQLKSDKVRTADTLISSHITWPHEVVYTATGKPAMYDDISPALFVNGYLIVM